MQGIVLVSESNRYLCTKIIPMDYIELTCTISDFAEWKADLVSEALLQQGFESFSVEAEVLKAYVPENSFSEEKVRAVQFPFSGNVSLKFSKIEDQNWNKEWETHYFEPIVVAGECVIRAPFHRAFPEITHEIVIEPKMAFGTGHHETTSLMLGEILALGLNNKSVIDMGCGTGVLAILASMRGASPVTAIDFDEWSVKSALENCPTNGQPSIEVIHGDASVIPDRNFDYFFANINLNTLLADMHIYEKHISSGGTLLLSGFYDTDLDEIREKAENLGLTFKGSEVKNKWTVAFFVKK